jgi:hypothetical protein
MMSTTNWVVLISMILYLSLSILAFKYPRGREDWGRDWRETLYLSLSAVVFLMLLFLLWFVSAVVDWPSALTIIFWGSVITLIALVLIGVFVPHGIKLSFSKKVKEMVEEEE